MRTKAEPCNIATANEERFALIEKSGVHTNGYAAERETAAQIKRTEAVLEHELSQNKNKDACKKV